MTVLRSLLFAPGNHVRRVEKCLTIPVDGVILDLEDAVAVNEKTATRALIVEALSRPRDSLGYVRVNGMTTEWCYGDFVSVVRAGTDGIMLPKVESQGELATADWLLTSLEREKGLPQGSIDLIPIVETALGFSRLQTLMQNATRAKRFAFGAGDFTLDLGLTWTSAETELLPFRTSFVVESRAAGLEPPIDTVWIDLPDRIGFEKSVQTARSLGFQGKCAIHPDQVPVINRIFRPSEEEVAYSRKVVEAFEQAEAQNLAAIRVDGKFVDYPIVDKARRLLRTEARIADREAIRARSSLRSMQGGSNTT